MSRKSDAERQEWIERLRKRIKPGDTVYTVLRHVSRSGMSRRIGVVVKDEDGHISAIDGQVAAALGWRWDRDKGGVIVGGCGMDMGFHLVYALSAALYHAKQEDGQFRSTFACVGKGCPSNDHSNREKPPAGSCTGEDCKNLDCKPWIHSDGGYALRHRWL